MFEVWQHYFFIYNAEPHEFRSARMATNSLQRQITADRGMSLATREQKAVMTNFVCAEVFRPFFQKGQVRTTTKRR